MAKLPLDKMAAQLEDIANDITGEYERKKVYPWDRIADATATIAEAVGAEVPDKKYSTKKAQVADTINAIADADVSGGGGSGGDFAGLVDGTITQAHDSTVTSIRSAAFANCSMLSDIDFPNVETIETNAFAGSMFSAVDPITSSVYINDSRVPIVSATFPKCKTIGSYAFTNCYQLSQISFPECTTIGYCAFNYCPIKEAVFPKCVSLGSSPFYSDTTPLLEVAVFPALSRLEQGCFESCANLKTVMLKDCTYIASAAFAACTSLESLYVLGSSVATLSTNNAYYSPLGTTKIPTDGYIYVPASLVDSYKVTGPWSNYSSRFEGLTDEEIAEILGE